MKGLCRTCLCVADQPKPLFSEDERLETPAHLVWKCTGVRLTKEDNLPELLCIKCFTNLSIANDFRLLVEKSNTHLLGFNNVKVEFESSSSIKHDTKATIEDVESKFCINSKKEVKLEINDDIDNSAVINEHVEIENDNTSDIDISEVKIEIEETHSNDNFVNNEPSKVDDQNEDPTANDSDKIDCDQPFYMKVPENYTDNSNRIIVTGWGPDRRYQCPVCPFNSLRKPVANQHYRRHTGERPFKCDECGKYFVQQSTLNFHKKTVHSCERNFQCTLCDKNYKTKPLLNAHTKTHKEQLKYTCHLCEYTSSVKRYLSKHLMRHNTDKAFTCHLCKFTSSTQMSLTQHLKRHSAEKKYVCNSCEYATNIRCNLVMHMKRHELKNKFACQLCEFTTTMKEYLNTHVGRLHPEARPFKCDVCRKSCRSASGLKLHMMKHGKNLTCPMCKMKFTINQHLKQHMLDQHGIVIKRVNGTNPQVVE